jgi:hypothetical protein
MADLANYAQRRTAASTVANRELSRRARLLEDISRTSVYGGMAQFDQELNAIVNELNRFASNHPWYSLHELPGISRKPTWSSLKYVDEERTSRPVYHVRLPLHSVPAARKIVRRRWTNEEVQILLREYDRCHASRKKCLHIAQALSGRSPQDCSDKMKNIRMSRSSPRLPSVGNEKENAIVIDLTTENSALPSKKRPFSSAFPSIEHSSSTNNHSAKRFHSFDGNL